MFLSGDFHALGTQDFGKYITIYKTFYNSLNHV